MAVLAEAMNASSASVAHGVDEFGLAGLAAAPSRLVAPPRVADSPATLECRLIALDAVLHRLIEADHHRGRLSIIRRRVE